MTKKQKILIVGPGYPYRNGQSVFLAHLGSKLQENFDVELVNFTMLYPKFLFPGSTQFDNSKDAIRFPNTRMLSSLDPFSWRKTARYINNADPDLIAIDWWHPFFGPCMYGLTSFLKKALKERVVFITENVISHEANKVDKVLTRLGLKHANCFLALSNAVEQQLNGMFRKKVFRSALPIYDQYNKSDANISQATLKAGFGFDADSTVFLFFGLVRKYKGLDLLLRSFAQLLQKMPKARLLVAGEFYEDDKPYFDLIEQYQLKGHINIQNKYIANEDVADYFNACDIVAMPYRSATQSGIMSMAYGFKKPVVVTDVGELAQLVKPGATGLVVPPLDTAAFADAMYAMAQQKLAGFDFESRIADHLTDIDQFERIGEEFEKMLEYLQENKK